MLTVYNSIGFSLSSIIGYGTFITNSYWKGKANVEVCVVKNFTRIYPRGSWFPYALRSNGSFRALKFVVSRQELANLDRIEGVFEGLFERIKIPIYLKDNIESFGFIYIPTYKTIKVQNLSLELDKTDRWKEEIKKSHEISTKFPELIT